MDPRQIVRSRCERLWRLAHALATESGTADIMLSRMLDKEAKELAARIGLTYNDFNHAECTCEPDTEDWQYLFNRKPQ